MPTVSSSTPHWPFLGSQRYFFLWVKKPYPPPPENGTFCLHPMALHCKNGQSKSGTKECGNRKFPTRTVFGVCLSFYVLIDLSMKCTSQGPFFNKSTYIFITYIFYVHSFFIKWAKSTKKHICKKFTFF
jgi:hypothetical protein